MQFTPQGMGGGAAMPNGGYVGLQQPANQGQNMYGMQQGQWGTSQVTLRELAQTQCHCNSSPVLCTLMVSEAHFHVLLCVL